MKFEFYIGGYFANHCEVALHDDELHFRVSDYAIIGKVREPSHKISIKGDPDWENLLEYLSALNWLPEYDAPILDGIQWSIYFENENKHLTSNGSNAYPDDFDEMTSLLQIITRKYMIDDELLGKRQPLD